MNPTLSIISKLSSYLPFMFYGVVVTILGIAGYFLLMIRSARKKQKQEKAEAEPTPPSVEAEPVVPAKERSRPATLNLKRSFSRATKKLRANIPGGDYLYKVPWFLMIGEKGCGKTAALDSLDLSLPVGKPIEDGMESGEGCNWWLYDQAVVLDVEGDLVLSQDGAGSNEKGWETLVQLLKKHRPERPLDGVILTIPCGDLIGSQRHSEERTARAVQKANLLYAKLSELQRRSGICFPIYVLVTQCDKILGFKSFTNEIPVQHRDNIFGWSNPYSLERTYSPEWANQAFQEFFQNLYEAQIELIADGVQSKDGDGFFIMPSEFEAVAEPLRVYMNNLFRQSAYHDTFFLRGMYFTGDGTLDESFMKERHAPAPAPVQAPPKKKSLADLEKEASLPPLGLDDEPPLGEPPLGEPLLGEPFAQGLETDLGADKDFERAAPFWTAEAEEPQKIRPMFLKELFEKKIFPEFALGRPAAKSFRSLNKSVIAAQIVLFLVALIGGLGLWTSQNTLQENTDTLTPVLKRTVADLNELAYKTRVEKESEHDFFQKSSLNLLEGMTQIGADTFSYFFLPSSWFDSIDEDIQQAMTLAYNKIILKSLFLELTDKAEEALEDFQRFESLPTSAGDNILEIESFPEYQKLNQAVDRFRQLETIAGLYNRLGSSDNLADLSKIVDFLFGVQLPSGFFTNAYFYHQALQKADYPVFHPASYQKRAVQKVARLADHLYGRIFHQNALEGRLENLARRIDGLESGQMKAWPAENTLREFEDLIDSISYNEIALTQPEFAWFGNARFDLGPHFDNTLKHIRSSRFLGDQLGKQIQQEGLRSFEELQSSLAAKSANLTGPILARGTSARIQSALQKIQSTVKTPEALDKIPQPTGTRSKGTLRMALAPGVLNLRSTLQNFLGHKFISLDLPHKELIADFSQGFQLIWDKKFLQESIKLYEQYDLFLREGVKDFPESIRPLSKRAARKRLEKNMTLLIAHAQDYKPSAAGLLALSVDENVGPEVANFKDASKALGWLMDIFNEMDYEDGAWALSQVAALQASNLLKTVDRVLDQENLYNYKQGSFAWWAGEGSVSLAAFEAGDARELEYYLDIQRSRISHMAKDFAEPLIRFLINRTFYNASDYESTIARWQSILTELQRFEGKKTGNSVTALEKFILFDMDKITVDNRCRDSGAKTMAPASGDYFLRKLLNLRAGIFDRCKFLVESEVGRRYAVIESYFNQKLAGRFPFAPASAEAVFTEADPDDVREFFWLLDQYKKAGLPLLKKSAEFGVSGEETLAFVEKMEKVRAFFSGFLGADKEVHSPQFVLNVDLRVNQGQEIGANQIIDWRLAVGDQTYGFLDKKRALKWKFGDPVKLTLRWAKDSPSQPLAYTTPGAEVRDGVVEFVYSNRWSLLSMLKGRETEAEDFEALFDPNPHTLKFLIGTEKVDPEITRISESSDDWGKDLEMNQVKFFIHVGTLEPEKTAVKTLPDFPFKAPHLKETEFKS